MFCPKCGTHIPDGSRFCNHCGAQLGTQVEAEQATQVIGQTAGNTAPIPPAKAQAVADAVHMPNAYQGHTAQTGQAATQGQYQQAAPPAGYAPAATATSVAPAKKRRVLPILLGIVALILLALLGLQAFRSCTPVQPQGTPEGVVETASRAILDLDFDTALDTLPPELLQYALSAAGMQSRSDLVNYLNNSVADLEEQSRFFGINIRDILKLVEIKTSDVSYYSDDGLAGLKNEWNSRIPGFGDKFEDAANVTVGFSGQFDIFGQTISLSDYIGSAEQVVTTVQIDGKWYLLEGDLNSLTNFGSVL